MRFWISYCCCKCEINIYDFWTGVTVKFEVLTTVIEDYCLLGCDLLSLVDIHQFLLHEYEEYLLGCDTVSSGTYLCCYYIWFVQGPCPVFPLSISTLIVLILGLLFYHEDRGSTFLWNVGNIYQITWYHIPKDCIHQMLSYFLCVSNFKPLCHF
jgi:hypothetical protein